jgi:hypothetical protein
MPPYGTTAAAEEVEAQRQAEAEEKPIAEGGRESGKTPNPPSEEPDPIEGYIQGWIAQVAVDGTAQIIVRAPEHGSATLPPSTREVSGRRSGMRSSYESTLS